MPENAVDRIRERLWIGGIRALVDTEILDQMDVIISIVERDRIPEPIYALCIGDRPHLRVRIADGDTALIAELPAISKFISQHRTKETNILIHCMAGHSRSVVVLAYYMVTRMGYPNLELAVAKIRSRRPAIRPKPVLLEATLRYLNESWYNILPLQE
jgi:predicted protein tyrosine phosphatase